MFAQKPAACDQGHHSMLGQRWGSTAYTYACMPAFVHIVMEWGRSVGTSPSDQTCRALPRVACKGTLVPRSAIHSCDGRRWLQPQATSGWWAADCLRTGMQTSGGWRSSTTAAGAWFAITPAAALAENLGPFHGCISGCGMPTARLQCRLQDPAVSWLACVTEPCWLP